MRILLDTNVLVSAILFGGTPRRLLEGAIEGRVRLVTSRHLLEEFEGILEDTFGFSKAAAVETRAELEVLAELVLESYEDIDILTPTAFERRLRADE